MISMRPEVLVLTVIAILLFFLMIALTVDTAGIYNDAERRLSRVLEFMKAHRGR